MAGDTLKYAEAVRRALHDALEEDPSVIVMGQEVAALGGVFTATQDLASQFPERVLDTPLVESATVGWAIGASMMGMRPVVEIMFMDFITTAMDQVVNGAAKLRYMSGGQACVPIVIRMPADAGTRHGPQHSQHLETWFAHVPGLIVAMPSNANDAYWMLRQAISADDPVVFIESKYLYFRDKGKIEPSPMDDDGPYRARVVREGRHLTVVTAGRMVQETLTAADELQADGIECEVVDLRYVWPWDKETVRASLEKTARLAIVHEAVRDFGWGGEISAHAADEWFYSLDAPVLRIGAARTPVPFATDLENQVIPQAARIVDELRSLAKH